jgi:hypothetical protein
MNIIIYRDGKQYGPYTLEQIKEGLDNGTLAETDLGWHDGCKDWTSLKTIITPLTSPPPPPPNALATTLAYNPQGIAGRVNESIDLVGLPPYYQKEFKKIYESGESYQGTWNWDAFLFGGLWALAKGCWLSLTVCVVISIVLGIITCGIGSVFVPAAYWFIYAIRGNYIYYCAYVKRRQIAF